MTVIPEVVDAHHHLWDLDDYHVWLHAQPRLDTFVGDIEPIVTDYLATDFLADAESVPLVKSVHVQAEFDPSRPVDETAWLQSQADRTGFPHGIVGYADLAAGNVREVLEAHAQFRNFRGIRHMVNWDSIPGRAFAEHDGLMSSDDWRRGFALLADMGHSFDLQLWPRQMHEAAALATDYPDSRIAVNHTGFPIDRDEDGMRLWREGMRALAERPNVHVKISGLGMLDHAWTVETIRPLVLQTIDIFGTDRCMFASNFPVDKLYSSYADIFNAFSQITAGFSESEREGLFSRNASRFYRLT
jgi:predicted TIM-barrel fold metal-dependent hydrolase